MEFGFGAGEEEGTRKHLQGLWDGKGISWDAMVGFGWDGMGWDGMDILGPFLAVLLAHYLRRTARRLAYVFAGSN